jgi:hypothetical protein
MKRRDFITLLHVHRPPRLGSRKLASIRLWLRVNEYTP